MQNNIKHDMIKYMKPSGSCQTCQSQAQLSRDCIITCQTCRSCIHQTHYGSELLQPQQNWHCERCRYFLQNGASDIACQFCPNLRGIMKQYLFQNRKMWLHPECAAWGYPIIYFATNKKQVIKKEKPKSQSTYFWVPDYEVNENPCQVCKELTGYRLKCKYYSCRKSYHVTCGRPEGIVRDLESMKIENASGYFPVYCRQHIELKIQDCRKRVKLLKEKGDTQKAAHYHKIANLFSIQLKNLEEAVKKCKQEQEMIKKMSLETRRNVHPSDNINTMLDQLAESFHSQQSNQFLNILQSEMIDESLPLQPIQKIKIFEIKPAKVVPIPTTVTLPVIQKPKTRHIGRPPKNRDPPPSVQIITVNYDQNQQKSEMQDEGKKNAVGYEALFQEF